MVSLGQIAVTDHVPAGTSLNLTLPSAEVGCLPYIFGADADTRTPLYGRPSLTSYAAATILPTSAAANDIEQNTIVSKSNIRKCRFFMIVAYFLTPNVRNGSLADPLTNIRLMSASGRIADDEGAIQSDIVCKIGCRLSHLAKSGENKLDTFSITVLTP